MGKSKTTIHERQLTPEERQLIAMQGRYLNSIQPSIDALVNYGTNNISNIVTPDWQKLYNDQTAEMQQIKSEFTPLSQGILPDVFANAKQNYFNRMYENTMGKNLASLAQRGVVDSSRFNTTTNDMQKNFASQMSQDYDNNLKTAAGLLDQRMKYASTPIDYAQKAHQASFAPVQNSLALAQGQNQATNQALQTQGQLNNGRTFATQSSSGGFLGGALSLAGSIIACFPSYVMVAMADGSEQAIGSIQEGDKVKTRHGEATVSENRNMGMQRIFLLVTNNHKLRTTDTEVFNTPDGRKELSELSEGDKVETENGFERIEFILDTEDKEEVFELVLDTDDNMFLAEGIYAESF